MYQASALCSCCARERVKLVVNCKCWMLNYVQLFRIMMIFMILLHITLDITSLIVENNFPSWHQLHVKEAMSNNTLVSHLLLFKLMTRYWWIFYNQSAWRHYLKLSQQLISCFFPFSKQLYYFSTTWTEKNILFFDEMLKSSWIWSPNWKYCKICDDLPIVNI